MTVAIADDASNGDIFRWAPDVTIMDPQKHDVLKFYGVALTGGEVGSSALSLLGGAFTGNALTASTIVGAVGAAAAAVNVGRAAAGLGPVYYDTFLPFIAYTTVSNGDGTSDLKIVNLIDKFLVGPLFNPGSSGAMTVKNYHMANSSTGAMQPGKSRRVAAANDDQTDAWPERPFRLLGAAA